MGPSPHFEICEPIGLMEMLSLMFLFIGGFGDCLQPIPRNQFMTLWQRVYSIPYPVLR